MKKLIIGMLIGMVLVTGIVIAFETYWNDLGLVIEMPVALPQSMINSINGYEGVVLAETDGQNTIIILEESFANGIGYGTLNNYFTNLERKVENNNANKILYPDGNIPPLCLRDSNGNINGLYSVGNELYLEVNDVRC